MAEPVPTGSDVSAGTYRCTNCGQELTLQSEKSLPPCPNCNGTSLKPSVAATASRIRTRTSLSACQIDDTRVVALEQRVEGERRLDLGSIGRGAQFHIRGLPGPYPPKPLPVHSEISSVVRSDIPSDRRNPAASSLGAE